VVWCGVVGVRACVALAAPTGPCCGWQSRGPDVRANPNPGVEVEVF
jgi:hypothetical protein